jgi:hypothetical protein
MIKLLRCKKCGELTKRPRVTVLVTFYTNWRPGRVVRCTDPDFDIGRGEWNSYTLTCPQDDATGIDGVCGGELEIVVFDQCPHHWSIGSSCGTPVRHCLWCDAKQFGRVTFDE